MADWTTPGDWVKFFGFVALPFFGKKRNDVPRGIHAMMQDGDAASFVLHVAPHSQLLLSETALAWTWSSHVRTNVVLDPQSKLAIVRKWDDPSHRDERVISSDSDARDFVRSLERQKKPPLGRTVIDRSLEVFGWMRTALEQRGATDVEVVTAFNVALLMAEQWRTTPNSVPALALAEVVEQLRKQQRPGFDLGLGDKRVKDYPVGQFVKTLLEQKPVEGSSYFFDPSLLIRHASGLLCEEAHRQLLGKPQQFRPGFWDDGLPSGRAGRRKKAPSYVHHTPPWLARMLVESALTWCQRPKDDWLDVLDPACGSGVFLIETARELDQFKSSRVRLRGMDESDVAKRLTAFYVGKASAELERVTVDQSIQGDVDSLAQETDWGNPDIILMNPPFKAWKDLDENGRENVKRVLGEYMAHRPDLYLAFLLRAALALRPGGVLACVVPSAFFSADSAEKVRGLLSSSDFQIRMVAHFRGFETFEKPLVEAAVIVVTRTQGQSPVRVLVAENGKAEKAVRLLRATGPNDSVEKTGIDIFHLPNERLASATWILPRRRDWNFAESLRAATRTTVEDLFTVRSGIRGLGGRKQKKPLLLPEREFARLVGRNAGRQYFRPVADQIENGRIVLTGFVFYPYSEDGQLILATDGDVQTAVPEFYRQVLLPAKQELQARKSINRKPGKTPTRQWWEPSEPVKTWLAKRQPRIVSQEFGRKGNFAFDEQGRFAVAAGTGWCWNRGELDSETLLAYLAVLNSNVFDRLLKVFCPKLQGPFRLEGRFVHFIPLPDLTAVAHVELSQIGQQIHSGKPVDEAAQDEAVLAAYRMTDQDALKEKFDRLAARWKKETQHLSSAMQIARHPAYREIVGMGKAALPLILEDLRRKPDDWFVALHEITGGINPIPTESEGFIKKMAQAWINWGQKEGLIR